MEVVNNLGIIVKQLPTVVYDMGRGQRKRTLESTLEIAKNGQNRKYLPVYAEIFWTAGHDHPIILFYFVIYFSRG